MGSQVIVVGLDGSDRSHDALRFAIEEARLREASVEVLTTWREDSQGDTREQAERIQAQARDLLPERDGIPPVSFQVVHGRPQEVLVNASDRATLVVIGAHGVQSIRRAALGSISEYVARLASCPVVVMPAGAATGAAPGE